MRDMFKRLGIALLALVMLLCAFPAAAGAEVISGYTSKVDYDNTDPSRYYIEIDLTNQVITVYEKDIAGVYSTVAVQGLCTTGSDENPTGAGTYKLGDLKERFGYFVAFGQYAQYWTQVVRGIYIHSIMYNDADDLSTMSKSAYRTLGKAASHGCVRVLPEVAQFIFYNCPPGTTCRVTAKKEKDPALVKALKDAMPAYADYQHPEDAKADPAVIPGVVRYNSTPLRTGFSNSRDKTVATLKAGDRVDILQLGADWMKVRTMKGKLGYVKTQYVLCDPDAEVQYEESYAAIGKTYVYEDMDTDSIRLAEISKGTSVDVYENPAEGWYFGKADGVEGYLRTKYVKGTESMVYPTLSGAVIEHEGETVLAQHAMVKRTLRARFRDAAGMDSNVIGVLEPGTYLSIISMDGSWYYASVNGMKGYISATCVDMMD